MAQPAGRNNTLTSIAGKLRARGSNEQQILAELLNHSERNALPDSEVRAIARSIGNKPPGLVIAPPVSGWPSPLHQLAAVRGWSVEALEALGAFSEKGEVHFPMHDATGAITGHRRRLADNAVFRSGKKALSVKGSKNGLLMPWPLPDDGLVLVVEGEADACAALSAGWKAVVATPGAEPGAPCIQHLQKVLAGRTVVLAPDPDGPGEQWRDKIANALHAAQCTVRFLPPLPDLDLDKRLARVPGEEGKAWLRKQIEEAVEWKHPPAPSAMQGAVRCMIRLGTDEGRVNDQVLKALARDEELYERGGKLMQVVASAAEGSPRIVAIAEGHLRDRIARHCAFLKADATSEQPELMHPPVWCVRALHQRGHWPGIRPLTGIIESPALRPDGTVLEEPGYDTATGLLYIPNSDYPKIPHCPTREQAQAAARNLLDVIAEFPFADDVSRSVWLAFLLTLVAREAIVGCVPLFAFDANVRGSGKTLVVKAAVLIATGREVSVTSHPRDEDEFRKRISSFALEGRRVALLDNISGDLGSDALDAALTSTMWDDRRLGSLASLGEIPLRIVWSATGNNLSLRGDMVRRVLFARIESAEEKPEERRDFKHPRLLDHIRRYRTRLHIDALTIVRAYIVAECPDVEICNLGSFEEWADLIARAIVWCGLPDPLASRVIIQEKGDRDQDFQVGIVSALERNKVERTGLAAAAILRLAQDDHDLFSLLDEAMGPPLTAKRLGKRLGALRNRVVNGKQLKSRTIGGNTLWLVEESKERTVLRSATVDVVDIGGFISPRAGNIQSETDVTETGMKEAPEKPPISTKPTSTDVDDYEREERLGIQEYGG